MHIQSALAGVDEESRCSNWRKGGPCGQKVAGAADSGASHLLEEEFLEDV